MLINIPVYNSLNEKNKQKNQKKPQSLVNHNCSVTLMNEWVTQSFGLDFSGLTPGCKDSGESVLL